MRLPSAPLEAYAELRFGNRVIESDHVGTEFTCAAGHNVLVEILGLGRTTIYRWRKDGLSIEQADQIAIQLGIHPASLWPEWYSLPAESEAC